MCVRILDLSVAPAWSPVAQGRGRASPYAWQATPREKNRSPSVSQVDSLAAPAETDGRGSMIHEDTIYLERGKRSAPDASGRAGATKGKGRRANQSVTKASH